MLEADAEPHRVAGLVLIDPALPRAAGSSVDLEVLAMFLSYMLPGLGEWVLRRRYRGVSPEQFVSEMLALVTVDPRRVSPRVIEASLELARFRLASPWAVEAFLSSARSMMRLLAQPERIRAIIDRISVPTLLMMGRQDRLVALPSAEALARLRPDWDFVVFDELGHAPMIEDPVRASGASTTISGTSTGSHSRSTGSTSVATGAW